MIDGVVVESERTLDMAVVMDADGAVVHNAMQQDDPVIRRTYSDGTVQLLSQRTGKLLVAPYKPEEMQRFRCPHCNGELGGDGSR